MRDDVASNGPKSMGGRSRNLFAEILAGLLSGAVAGFYAVSFAHILFTGALAPFIGDGARFFLAGTLVLTIAACLRRPFTGVMWQPQSIVLVVLIGATHGMATSHPDMPDTQMFASVLLMVAVATTLSGALMLVLGAARLGRIAQSIPYPVIGGFIAATGLLLILRAALFAGGDSSDWRGLLSLERAQHWAPPLVGAMVMLLLSRRTTTARTLSIGFFGYAAAVYAGLWLSGMSLAEARAAGFLLDSVWPAFMAGGVPLLPELAGGADWNAILGQYPLLLTAAAMATLGTLMSFSANELVTRATSDIDSELRVTGAANFVAGAAGGVVGYGSVTLTSLSTDLAGRPGRLVAITAAATVLGLVLSGSLVFSVLPRGLLAMLLAYMGVSFLHRWLWIERSRMPRNDYLIVLAILLVSLGAGFAWAVLVGIIIASMRFTVAYSRLPALRSAVSGAVRLSSTERSEAATGLLIARGGETQVIELQGYMFFGTANGLFVRSSEMLERRHQGAAPLRHMVVDFRSVHGMDVSAVVKFVRLAEKAAELGVDLLFSGARDDLRTQLAAGLGPGMVRFHNSLDDALIAVEEEVLRRNAPGGDMAVFKSSDGAFRDLLERIETSSARLAFRREIVGAGAHVFEMGEAATSLLLLERGRLYATVREGEKPARRVATFLPGAVVGEIAFVTGQRRTATVIAETDSALLWVARADLEHLRTHEPALAQEMSGLIASLLAQRLTRTTALLHAISR